MSYILKIKLISKIKIIFFNFFFGLLFFIILDLIYSNYFFKIKKYPSLHEKDIELHHKHKKNFSGVEQYGILKPFVCTDDFGLKSKCNSKTSSNYDLGIVGDSIIEGVGLTYNETLTGILSENTNYKIANLGTGSYSPILYHQRLLDDLFNKKLTFKHIIIFIDLSDIEDELLYYKEGNSIKSKLDDIKIYEWEERENQKKNLNDISFKTKIRKLVSNNLKISFNTISFLKRKFYTSNPYKIHRKDIPRYAWTYNKEIKSEWGRIDVGIESSEYYMDKIYNLLNSKGIKFSIAVYPAPQQLLYDVENNHQVKIWKKFCENKCYKFYNFNKIFFKKKREMDLKKLIKKYFITYDEHFNYEGNKLIANEFLEINKN